MIGFRCIPYAGLYGTVGIQDYSSAHGLMYAPLEHTHSVTNIAREWKTIAVTVSRQSNCSSGSGVPRAWCLEEVDGSQCIVSIAPNKRLLLKSEERGYTC